MNDIKKIIKTFVPQPLLFWYRKPKYNRLREMNGLMTTKEVFTKIYEEAQWGGKSGEFCSGRGSNFNFVQSYCELVKTFIRENDIQNVLDLGCGDFVVGANLQLANVKYTGVDIVEPLIESNNQRFGNQNISFSCLNIINDDLPNADLCLIRQVLQHLSNDQILKILQKTKKFKYVIITEHYPPENLKGRPNIDKPHGGDTRIVDNSGVYLDKHPFNIHQISTLLEVKLSDYICYEGEKLKTMLIINK